MNQQVKFLSAVVLSLAAGGAMAQELAANTLPSTISFDGYCETLTGIMKLGTAYTGTYNECGQRAVPAGGPAGFNLQGIKGAGAAFMAETYPYYGATYIFSISTKGTWAVTNANGDQINAGTWTAGASMARGTTSLIPR